MKDPEDVQVMLRLHALGWGSRRIAKELGVSRNTVRAYLRQGGWQPYKKPARTSVLDGHQQWLRASFLQHRGNAEVVRQELERVHQVRVSLRTVERAVAPYRRELRAAARATVRFETPPGRQLQIDFGSCQVEVDGERVRVRLFVATLGFSRRLYVRATRHERQSAWLQGLEGAFRHFDGVPSEVLVDNAKALVTSHDASAGEVVFNDRFQAFCAYWGVTPRACKPYRARTKGKDERSVGYVKRNAIAGRTFTSWAALEAHLVEWTRDVADQRIHGTTEEKPAERFDREEAAALQQVDGRAPFLQLRELARRVHSDACVMVDTNAYSVPWHLIGSEVTVTVHGGQVAIHHAGEVVGEHAELAGRGQRSVLREHLDGVVGVRPARVPDAAAPAPEPPEVVEMPELLRPLEIYEDAVGGPW
jgi:transposase